MTEPKISLLHTTTPAPQPDSRMIEIWAGSHLRRSLMIEIPPISTLLENPLVAKNGPRPQQNQRVQPEATGRRRLVLITIDLIKIDLQANSTTSDQRSTENTLHCDQANHEQPKNFNQLLSKAMVLDLEMASEISAVSQTLRLTLGTPKTPEIQEIRVTERSINETMQGIQETMEEGTETPEIREKLCPIPRLQRLWMAPVTQEGQFLVLQRSLHTVIHTETFHNDNRIQRICNPNRSLPGYQTRDRILRRLKLPHLRPQLQRSPRKPHLRH